MSAPSYILNWEEFLEVIGDKLEINIDDIDLSDLEDYLKGQLDLIVDLLRQILDLLKNKGGQMVHSISNHIPAVVAPYKFTTSFDKDVMITGVTYSQSAWKYQDSWDLVVDGTVLFEEVGTKEIGESKQMNVFYFVPAGKEVDIIFHNDSGNSRLVWFDIEYIDLSIDKSAEPDLPPIDNPYDYLVVMSWEDNTGTDLDLHCYFDCNIDDHVYYSQKELVLDENNKAWLNYDYTSHGSDGRKDEPENISILGMDNHTSNIYVTNYNKGVIKEDVTVDIYNRVDNRDVKIGTVVVDPSQITGERSVYIGNIKNGVFEGINQNISYGTSSMDMGSCRI